MEKADLVQIGTCNSCTHTLTPTHTHAPSRDSPAATPCSPFQKACAIALYKAPSQSDIVCFGEKDNGRPRCSAAIASMVSVMTSMNLALSCAVNPALCEMARKSGWNVCQASEWPAMPRMCSFAVNTCRTGETNTNGQRLHGRGYSIGSSYGYVMLQNGRTPYVQSIEKLSPRDHRP